MKVTKLFTLLAGSSLLFSASVFAANGTRKHFISIPPLLLRASHWPPVTISSNGAAQVPT